MKNKINFPPHINKFIGVLSLRVRYINNNIKNRFHMNVYLEKSVSPKNWNDLRIIFIIIYPYFCVITFEQRTRASLRLI